MTIGTYHLARAIAPPHLREQQAGEGAVVVVDAPGAYREEPVEEAAPPGAYREEPVEEAAPERK